MDTGLSVVRKLGPSERIWARASGMMNLPRLYSVVLPTEWLEWNKEMRDRGITLALQVDRPRHLNEEVIEFVGDFR